jgi:hypothetical protein
MYEVKIILKCSSKPLLIHAIAAINRLLKEFGMSSVFMEHSEVTGE